MITLEELDPLQEWMDANCHLRTCWPYDELEAVLMSVLADGVIDANEHQSLLRFFTEFTEFCGHRTVELPSNPKSQLITGVCTVCPDVDFRGREFCFTGRSQRVSRATLAAQVESKGGLFRNSLVKSVDYLIIGADGNPCWAYACYGRKVEQAIEYRKKGCPILLVHENDYWDAWHDA